MTSPHVSRLLLLAALLICTIGCGDGRPQRVPVSGKVLIDGQPLKVGYIRFVPTGSRASGSSIDSEGRFMLMCFEPADGAVVGKHQVEVTASENLSRTKAKWHAPKKYSDYRQSGLTYDITGPTEDAVINLTWNGGAPFVEVDADGETAGK
jgi:hypothetical protein